MFAEDPSSILRFRTELQLNHVGDVVRDASVAEGVWLHGVGVAAFVVGALNVHRAVVGTNDLKLTAAFAATSVAGIYEHLFSFVVKGLIARFHKRNARNLCRQAKAKKNASECKNAQARWELTWRQHHTLAFCLRKFRNISDHTTLLLEPFLGSEVVALQGEIERMRKCAGTLGALEHDYTSNGTKVITSLNLKGGVGKTHLCWLITGVCEERGQKCLLVDLDKQGNLSTTLLGPAHKAVPGAESFFDPAIDVRIGDLIRKTELAHIDCVPGSFALERFNMTAPGEWKDSGLELSLVDPLREVSQFYDYILLDCPADISLITYAALCASDFLMIPLESAHWGALGTPHVISAFEYAQAMHNSRLQLLGYVASRFRKGRMHQREFLQTLREHHGDNAFETMIPDLAPFEKSVNDRIPIVLHSPSSHAANIAREFFDEVEARAERLRSVST